MSKAAILTALTGLESTHASVLADVRGRILAGQAGSPYDASRLLFAGVTLSPSEWAMVSRIERLSSEVDAWFATARRELSFAGDELASATERHQGTPARISEAMASLNADIASLTAALAAKSVTFQWSLLPAK